MITPEELKFIVNLIEENIDPENTPEVADRLYKKCNLLLEMAEFKEENNKRQAEFNNKMQELMKDNSEE